MTATHIVTNNDLLPILTHDIIEAIADCPHEFEARRADRARTAMRLIEAFEPGDGVEIMLVSQLVLMRSLMLDCLADARHAQFDDRRQHRQQALTTARMQLTYMKEIRIRREADPAVEAATPTVQVVPVTSEANGIPVVAPPARRPEAPPTAVQAVPRIEPMPTAAPRLETAAAVTQPAPRIEPVPTPVTPSAPPRESALKPETAAPTAPIPPQGSRPEIASPTSPMPPRPPVNPAVIRPAAARTGT